MEGKKKASCSAATGSSIVDDLFGPKVDAASSSSTTTAGYFSTVFPTPSAAMGKDASHRAHAGQGGKPMISSAGQTLHGGSPESPYFGSSSVHYGGRDFYDAGHRNAPPSTTKTAAPAPPDHSKDAGDTSAATRGDWWQGSLYY